MARIGAPEAMAYAGLDSMKVRSSSRASGVGHQRSPAGARPTRGEEALELLLGFGCEHARMLDSIDGAGGDPCGGRNSRWPWVQTGAHRRRGTDHVRWGYRPRTPLRGWKSIERASPLPFALSEAEGAQRPTPTSKGGATCVAWHRGRRSSTSASLLSSVGLAQNERKTIDRARIPTPARPEGDVSGIRTLQSYGLDEDPIRRHIHRRYCGRFTSHYPRCPSRTPTAARPARGGDADGQPCGSPPRTGRWSGHGGGEGEVRVAPSSARSSAAPTPQHRWWPSIDRS